MTYVQVYIRTLTAIVIFTCRNDGFCLNWLMIAEKFVFLVDESDILTYNIESWNKLS